MVRKVPILDTKKQEICNIIVVADDETEFAFLPDGQEPLLEDFSSLDPEDRPQMGRKKKGNKFKAGKLEIARNKKYDAIKADKKAREDKKSRARQKLVQATGLTEEELKELF